MSYLYTAGAEGRTPGAAVTVANSSGGGDTPFTDVQGSQAFVYSSAHAATGSMSFALDGSSTRHVAIWAPPAGSTLFSVRCALYVPSPGLQQGAGATVTFAQVFVDLGTRGSQTPQLLFGLDILDAADSYADDEHFFLQMTAGPMLDCGSLQTGPSMPCDQWLHLTAESDFTAQQVGLQVTDAAGDLIFSTSRDYNEYEPDTYGHYTAASVAYGNCSAPQGGPQIWLDDLATGDTRLILDPPDTDPDPDPDPDPDDDPDDPANPANDGTADGQVFDYGQAFSTAIPCPPQYRSAVASHAGPSVPRLGKALGYRVLITTRGGAQPVVDLPPDALSAVNWQRKVNDVAEHTITVEKRDRLLYALAAVEAWVHEIAIWRIPDRGQPQLVALGPLIDWTESRSQLVLVGRDMGAWFAKRAVHNDFAFVDGCTDLAEIARHVVNDAMGPDDPGLLPYARFTATGIHAQRSGQGLRLMLDKELSDLAGLGLDWTFVGRRMIVSGDLAAQWPHVARLGGQHFDEDVEINGAGAEALTRVIRSNAESSTVYIGYAGGVDPVLGLLEDTSSSDDIIDNATARTAARMALAAAYPVPYYVRVPEGAALSADAPITVDQLIPGVGVRVEISDYIKPMVGLQRLTQVAVAWTPEDGERVQVSLSPWAAAPPADDATVVATADDLGVADVDVETDPAEPILTQDADVPASTDDPDPSSDTVVATKTVTDDTTFPDKSVVLAITATLTAGARYQLQGQWLLTGSDNSWTVTANERIVQASTATFGAGRSLSSTALDNQIYKAVFSPVTFVPSTSGAYTLFVQVQFTGNVDGSNSSFSGGTLGGENSTLTITRLATSSSGGTTVTDAEETEALASAPETDDDADPDLNATATTDSTTASTDEESDALYAGGGDPQTDAIDALDEEG